ncbi:MAG: hypothetical protein Q8O43_10435 [Dehalococcoidia bacterium]|nr:hypothetical protein [Dehalococcoidia bacterium]
MPPEFLGKEIQVITGGKIKVPTAFTLEDKTYTVTEVVLQWYDHGFGPSSAGRRHRWWQRRHCTYSH